MNGDALGWQTGERTPTSPARSFLQPERAAQLRRVDPDVDIWV